MTGEDTCPMAVDRDEERRGLRMSGVRIARGGRRVLDDVSFTAPRGVVTVIVAPSGAGKSTLLRCCNRLLVPDAGTIALDGGPIAELDPRSLRRRVGLVGQQPFMLPGSVRENVAYGLDGVAEDRLLGALDAAGLAAAEFVDRLASELSGGERARVALARTLVRSPEMLLLDEPTAALDAAVAARLARTLRRLVTEEGIGILAATHDLAFAGTVADRAVALRDGRAVTGEVAAVLAAAAEEGAGDEGAGGEGTGDEGAGDEGTGDAGAAEAGAAGGERVGEPAGDEVAGTSVASPPRSGSPPRGDGPR
jgi:ABC-type multidrug transport system fused ATPase/permease subunit